MIDFHEFALAEAREAQRWYAERSVQAAIRFKGKLDEAISGIVANPDLFPEICPGFQYARIFGFPYIVVFRSLSSDVQRVLAVAHTSRESGYWQDRG